MVCKVPSGSTHGEQLPLESRLVKVSDNEARVKTRPQLPWINVAAALCLSLCVWMCVSRVHVCVCSAALNGS